MAATFTLISNNILNSTTASVTFSNIPSTYTDLVFKMSLRNNRAQAPDNLSFTINGVTSTLYSDTYLTSNGSSAGSSRQSNNTYNYMPNVQDANTATSNTFGNIELYIPNYLANQNKAMASFGAQENNQTQAYMALTAHLYRSTTAISSVTFSAPSGASFVAGSSFYLYGIKNS